MWQALGDKPPVVPWRDSLDLDNWIRKTIFKSGRQHFLDLSSRLQVEVKRSWEPKFTTLRFLTTEVCEQPAQVGAAAAATRTSQS